MATKKYKLKTKFEDFYVEERQELNLVENGQYSIFKLEKLGLDTVVALRISAKHLGVALANFGYSGLKDRYSRSTQYISVPARELTRHFELGESENVGESMKLVYVGSSDSPLQLGDHTSNFFRLTIRRLNPETLDKLKRNIEVLRADSWIPNYFDSQKFGFIKGPVGFFAGAFLKGEYEQALKLVIASPKRKERPRSKIVHKYIQEHWNDWASCSEFLAEQKFENYIDITSFLEKNPDDHLSAIKLISKDKMKLKITALQAYLWNEYLKTVISEIVPDKDLVEVKYHVGNLLFTKDISAYGSLVEKILKLLPAEPEQEHTSVLPLPSPGLEEPYLGMYNSLLARDFEINSISEFEKFRELDHKTNAYRRPLFFRPKGLAVENEGQDETIERKKNWYCTLTFDLPPGSYATVMIKALMLA